HSVGGLTVFNNLFGDALGIIDRNGEAQANVAFGSSRDRYVNADQSPGLIDQRPTGVPRVDGGIRLDHVEVNLALCCWRLSLIGQSELKRVLLFWGFRFFRYRRRSDRDRAIQRRN